jgi:hypothetical protein
VIVIAARPDLSNGIAEELASRARARFALPVFLAEESAPIAA